MKRLPGEGLHRCGSSSSICDAGKIITREPHVVAAHVADGKERTWTALGATCRDAHSALLSELETLAGRGDETVKVLLGVLEGPPGRARRRHGPAQGGPR